MASSEYSKPRSIGLSVAVGVLCLAVLVFLLWSHATTTWFWGQSHLMRLVASLAGAGLGAAIPGVVSLDFGRLPMPFGVIRASGALGLCALVFVTFDPGQCSGPEERPCQCTDGRLGKQMCVDGKPADCSCRGCKPDTSSKCECQNGREGIRQCLSSGEWAACACRDCEPRDEKTSKCPCPRGLTGRAFCGDDGRWQACNCPDCQSGEQEECTCPNGDIRKRQCSAAGYWAACACRDCEPRDEKTSKCPCPRGLTGRAFCGDDGRWQACNCPDCQSGEQEECECPTGDIRKRRCSTAGYWGACERCPPRECVDDAERPCRACETGLIGKQVCEHGRWKRCECPECSDTLSRNCQCANGREGTRNCIDGTWDDCVCPECSAKEARSCRCERYGEVGRRSCVHGKWSACDDCRFGAEALSGHWQGKDLSMDIDRSGSATVTLLSNGTLGNETLSGPISISEHGMSLSLTSGLSSRLGLIRVGLVFVNMNLVMHSDGNTLSGSADIGMADQYSWSRPPPTSIELSRKAR
jgi:hypothetical protein